jgi:3-hydroxymyristoyl/3-hydroxydecanoyl-(acyl carrier protein) dehydratase
MLEHKNVLVIGARAGGYGASIARAAKAAGAQVFGTSLTPGDPREQAFFAEIGTTLIEVPLRFDSDHRDRVLEDLQRVGKWLNDNGIDRLDAVVHTVAGGFPRQPSVMKAVGDILKGKHTFYDMATAVKRNVYYVNAGSFEDTINGLAAVTHGETQFVALTYRGNLPYFISPTKQYLEHLADRQARKGKRTLIAALPEAWTQSSQFFTGIEIAVLHNYVRELRGCTNVAAEVEPAFAAMERSLAELQGFEPLLADVQEFIGREWSAIGDESDLGHLSRIVHELFTGLRNKGTFPTLRRAVEIISDFVREASGVTVAKEFLGEGKYQAGDVRQVYYRDLLGGTSIGLAKQREREVRRPSKGGKWICYEKDEIRQTLYMYGKNFLFLDRVVMEESGLRDGFVGFGRFTVPTPEENPILKDHFVGMPIFGGHLQMEAVAQFGTFVMLKLLKDKKLLPILTGTEFPDLNTMAPPGETLTIMGLIRIPEKRNLTLEAFIENRYARSTGIIRGMILNERVVRKIMSSFSAGDPGD